MRPHDGRFHPERYNQPPHGFLAYRAAAAVSFILAYNLKPRFGTYPDIEPAEAAE
ncbi:MAG: hypothetical protein KJ052_15755 [Candidatus Hydrogenedentes bacterium]|nr:hypothetical protein [Candidatus Hydrogenedentota bacterium]